MADKKYAHEKLLEESGVSKKELPSDLLNKIKAFDMHKNKVTEKDNDIKSVAIAQVLYAWMEEAGHIVDGKPVEGKTETPSAGTETPKEEGKTETPAAGTETPAAGTETPAAGTETPPAGKTETPAAGTETPKEEGKTETPAAGTETPKEEGKAEEPPAKKKRWVPMLGWV